jgi:hypothetical protein
VVAGEEEPCPLLGFTDADSFAAEKNLIRNSSYKHDFWFKIVKT